jgi:hypothetical protein
MIRLLKSWTNKSGRKYPIGKILPMSNSLSKDLIRDNIAVEYKGEYPPKKKMKTDFFKPKEQ